MKVLFVVDTVSDIQNKINKIKLRFGDNIAFIVKAPFETLFRTYGYEIAAVYYKRLSEIMHLYLNRISFSDVIIYHASLDLTDVLVTKFLKKIKDGTKIVNVIPKYSLGERMFSGLYNFYVKSIFKIKDSMASPKLQYLPELFVSELLMSHFANKLFQLEDKFVSNLYIEETQDSKSLKSNTKLNKHTLIPMIVFMLLSIALILVLAFSKVNYLVALTFLLLYIIDIICIAILQFKTYFDSRFF